MPSVTIVAAGLAVLLSQTSTAGAVSRQKPQHVFASVLTPAGEIVRDLKAGDFVASVDDKRQEILSVGAAVEPLSVALLTDQLGMGNTYTAADIRETLKAFVDVVRADATSHTLSVTTFDGSVRRVVPFGSSLVTLDRALAQLTSASDDAYFLDALAETSRRPFPTRRRAIVAVLGSYRQDHSRTRTDELGTLLRDAGASLWAVEAVQQESGSFPNAPRELVLQTATELSGGMRETVSTRHQLRAAILRVAQRLLGQYDIAYGPGGGTTRSRLTLGVRRPNVTVLAPSWLEADR